MQKIFAAMVLAASLSVQAMDWTAKGYLNNVTGTQSASCPTCSYPAQMQFSAGAETAFNISGGLNFVTGGFLTQRNVKITATGSADANYSFMYLDIPLELRYDFNEMFSAYLGLAAGLKMSSSYPSGITGLTDKSLITPIQLGFIYNFNKQWEMELLYEMGAELTSSTTSSLKTASIIGLGVGYTF